MLKLTRQRVALYLSPRIVLLRFRKRFATMVLWSPPLRRRRNRLMTRLAVESGGNSSSGSVLGLYGISIGILPLHLLFQHYRPTFSNMHALRCLALVLRPHLIRPLAPHRPYRRKFPQTEARTVLLDHTQASLLDPLHLSRQKLPLQVSFIRMYLLGRLLPHMAKSYAPRAMTQIHMWASISYLPMSCIV